MINSTTNTPVYGGYHPNDLGSWWFSNFRVDSKIVIDFFNTVASKTAPLVHSVNRGELIFRVSDGGFAMQALRVKIGLTMVLKAWKNNNDLSHADILRQDIALGSSSTIESDTTAWLEQSWDSLKQLISQSGLREIGLPEFAELISNEDLISADPPEYLSEYDGY
jgi:hypothetical protein